MKKIEEEYSAALGKLIRVKEEVAAGDKTLDDLDEAMAEVRYLKKKRKMLQDADRLVEEGAELDVEKDPEEESEEKSPDFDAIDEELRDIIDEVSGHTEPQHEHAYIIGYKTGNEAKMCVAGDGASLLAMFSSLQEQKPFCSVKPLDARAHKGIEEFIQKIEKIK